MSSNELKIVLNVKEMGLETLYKIDTSMAQFSLPKKKKKKLKCSILPIYFQPNNNLVSKQNYRFEN